MATPRAAPAPGPDLTGRTVVVTGANAGLGKETVVALARAGADVVLCARDVVRGTAALDEARRRSGSDRIELAPLDLGSVASVHAFAEAFLADHARLDVLVNNGGLTSDEREQTVDGFEVVMAVNHLGHHLLTRLLGERLESTAGARVISISSVAHRRVLRPLTRDALDGAGTYDPFLQYARSKLAVLLFTRELARRVGPRGVTSVCCHPGLVRTGMTTETGEEATGHRTMVLAGRFMKDPTDGAREQVALASTADIAAFQGGYVARGRVRRPSRRARDAGAARWLWEESDRRLASVGVGL